MSIVARQSTALEISIGPVLDADGVAVTDCVVGDFKIKKTTGNFAALNGSATLTHVSAGTYDLVLTTSDTDTVGVCSIAIDDTTNACAPIYLQVIEEAIYDALYAASANAWSGAAGSSIGTANVTQLNGGAQSLLDLKDFADDGYDPSTNKVQGVVLTDTVTTYTGNTPQTGDSFARLTGTGAVTFASLTVSGATTLTGALTATNASNNLTLGTFTVTTNAIAWNANWDAEVQSEVQDAIEANHLDHFIAVADPGGVVANSSFLAKLVSKSATPAFSSYDNTTDSLEANRDNIGAAGAGLTAADDAVITLIGVAGAGLTEAGGDGDHLTAINLPNQTMDIVGNITGNLSGSVGSVTGAVGSVTGNVGGNVTGSVGSLVGHTVQTGDCFARLGAPAGASVSADIAVIAADLPTKPTKNVALSNFVFLMVDATDFNTPETGLTITATISKDGGSFASCSNSASEISGGFYKIDLTQTEMNANVVALKFTASGAAQRSVIIYTQPT